MIVSSIPSGACPKPAKRPTLSVLDGIKLYSAFGFRFPQWQVGLDSCVTESKAFDSKQ